MTEVGRLFQMVGAAELKARPPYAVLVRDAWSRVRNVIVIDEPECWLEWRLADEGIQVEKWTVAWMPELPVWS